MPSGRTARKTATNMLPSEHQIQASVIHWCRLNELQDARLHWVFAIPNGAALPHYGGGKGNKGFSPQANKLKAEGLLPGVSDLFVPIPAQGYHGLFLETKKPGGEVSEVQRLFMDAMSEIGYLAVAYYSFEEGVQVICEYLGLHSGFLFT